MDFFILVVFVLSGEISNHILYSNKSSKNTPLQGIVLHLQCYSSKSTEVLTAKSTESITSKSTHKL